MIIKRIIKPIIFAKQFRNASKFPLKYQEKILLKILKENKNTIYGKKFGFSKIKSIKEFQKKVPIITYPDIKDYIEMMKEGGDNILIKDKVLYFATSSGTTSDSKFIPITKKRMDFYRGEFLVLGNYYFKKGLKMIKGKTLYFAAGDLNGYTKAKIPHGNISGYLIKNSSSFVKNKLIINSDLLNIKNFEEKMQKIAVLSLLEKNIFQIDFSSAIQVILFFDYLLKNKEKLINLVSKKNKKRAKFLKELKDFKPIFIWPKIWAFNCVLSEFNLLYIKVIKEKLGKKDIHIRDPGILASEGRISLGITNFNNEGVLLPNESFLEFSQRKNEKFLEPILINKLKLGKQYKIIMTTFEGLYRYDLGDIVEVVGFKKKNPIVKFISRNKFLNITEEHAPEGEIIHGVNETIEKFNIKIKSFTILPHISSRKKPRYEILIEPLKKINKNSAKKLLEEIDSNWQKFILTYAETRNEFGRMDSPILSIVKKGDYDKLNSKIFAFCGQAKPINVTEDLNYKKKFNIEKTYKFNF